MPFWAASLATATNLPASLNPSTKPAITFVPSSSSRYRTKSEKSKSASFPVEMMWLSPMPLSTARVKNGPKADAPLWQTKPTGPVRPSAPREEALIQMSSFKLARPRQLGPLMRSPDSLAKAPNWSCNSRPSGVARSAKPAEITIAARTPF